MRAARELSRELSGGLTVRRLQEAHASSADVLLSLHAAESGRDFPALERLFVKKEGHSEHRSGVSFLARSAEIFLRFQCCVDCHDCPNDFSFARVHKEVFGAERREFFEISRVYVLVSTHISTHSCV